MVPYGHNGTYGPAVEVPSPKMGFEGLPRSPSVIIGHMDHALEYLHPGWVLRTCPMVPFGHNGTYGPSSRVPSPKMGFEGLPRSLSVIIGHMDMHSSTFTQDGF